LAIWNRKLIVGRLLNVRQRSGKQASLVLLLSLFGVVFGQNTRPNFTGTWRSIRITLGPVTGVLTQIEQSESTIAFRAIIPNETVSWTVYPTDGKVITTKRSWRKSDEKTGRWESGKLVLEETGPGNVPWRRSTTREVISLSEDGRIMTIAFHIISDPAHDYAIDYERINP
jgi:hypothetical protein